MGLKLRLGLPRLSRSQVQAVRRRVARASASSAALVSEKIAKRHERENDALRRSASMWRNRIISL